MPLCYVKLNWLSSDAFQLYAVGVMLFIYFFFLVKNIWLFLYVFKFYAIILACCMFFLDELQIRFFLSLFFQLKYFLLEHFFS